MTIFNGSTTNWVVTVQGADGQAVSINLPPGTVAQADGVQVNSVTYADDGLNVFNVYLSSAGSVVVSQSHSPAAMLMDGFWWGVSFSTILAVVWVIKKGFKPAVGWLP